MNRQIPGNFMLKNKVTLQELLEAGAHFGHQPRRWDPKMKPYLYGVREGIHIFDLIQTKKMMDDAWEFIKKSVAEGKTVLFIGTKRQAGDIIREEAKRAGVPFVSQRWLGGTITNWSQIKKSIKQLIKMREAKEAGEYKKYTKKENVLLARKIDNLEKFFGGLVTLDNIPDILFIVDVKKEISAIREANKKEIPVVAMVDSNSDPNLVEWPIPVNDDAVKSIKLVVSRMADAVIEGKQIKEKKPSAKKEAEKKTEKGKK